MIAAAWGWFTGTKLGRWLIELAAILAAAGAAVLYVYTRGKHAQAKTDAAKDASANQQAAQQVIEAATVRTGVEHETDKLPAAPPQTVASADPGTAAGMLRDDGWVRPAGPGQD